MAKRKGTKVVERADGWQSLVTGIGTSRDKRTSAHAVFEPRSLEELEQLYSGDEIASRIVNLVPEESLRRWVEWTNVDPQIADKIEDRCHELDLRGAIERSWKWGRAYGGACLYIVTDTSDPASPLMEGERVIGLRDLSRYDLRILTTDIETDFGSPNFGHPRIYYLTVQMGGEFKGYPIHWTRMIRFDGYLVPRRTFIRNNYWHDSVLNRLMNVIRNYQTSNDSAALILQDFNVGVYKMKNLANLIAAGKESVVKARVDMLNFSKSVIRAMIMDADDEEFVDLSRNVTGLAELLVHQGNRLVAATDIPHTKLLGESPDGSNATGNSTTNQWYAYIQAEQENYLRPRLQRLVKAIFGNDDLGFRFRSLYQPTDMETAELRNKNAQSDEIYTRIGALDPSEVCTSRFGGEQYGMEIKLDKEGRVAGLIVPHASDLPDMGGFDPEPPTQGQGNAESDQGEGAEPGVSDKPREKKDADSGTQYDLRNEAATGAGEKVKPLVGMSMSEPFRSMEPKVRPGGVPNKSRVIEPTVGNGVTAPRKDAQMGVVAVVAVRAGTKLLMGKRKDSGKWTLPGGHVLLDEATNVGAARELMEETGVSVKPEQLKQIGHVVAPAGFAVDTFELRMRGTVSIMPDADPDQEAHEWRWVDIANGLPPDVSVNLHHSPNYALWALGLQ